MSRSCLTAGELLALIRDRMSASDGGPHGCADCAPTRLSPVKPIAGGVNWQVLEHPRCSAPCQAMMLDVCSALAEQYDVQWSTMTAPTADSDPDPR